MDIQELLQNNGGQAEQRIKNDHVLVITEGGSLYYCCICLEMSIMNMNE